MSASRITRIAPTPSGFLHLGNAANIALTSRLAAQWGAEVALRIDDMDSTRARPEFVDDIFATLDWLEVPWSLGPRDRESFERDFTMSSRTDYYREQCERLRDLDLEVFACACSRSELAETGGLRCPRDCAEVARELVPHRTSLRLRVPQGAAITMAGEIVDLAAAHGDVVLWRRDDLPSYHLVTVIEDRDLGTTHIVRGADLIESSALHVWLAPYLGAENVAGATYAHHDLIVDPAGDKLSKSRLESGPLARTEEQREHVLSTAQSLATSLGY